MTGSAGKNNPIVTLTADQQRAVQTVGRDVLVSASAGTGKTATLSHRFVRLVCDPVRPVDVDQIVVLTFTEAAAEEMRTRIALLLRQAALTSRNSRLISQWTLLDGAYIGTIHSFCKRILTEFFYAADIDPAFEVLDPDLRTLLQAETLQQTLETIWQDSTLADGLRRLFEGRWLDQKQKNDFTGYVVRLSDYLDSIADREGFYARAAAANDARSAAYSALVEQQKKMLKQTLQRLLTKSRFIIELDRAFADGEYLTNYAQQNFVAPLEAVLAALAADPTDWTAAVSRLTAKLPKMPNKPPQLDEQTKTLIKSLADSIRIEMADLANWPLVNPAYPSLIQSAHQQAVAMLQMLRRFETLFCQRKQQLNTLDFADLEQKTLTMLKTHPETAQALQHRFAFIFVDEAQDLNVVQKQIIDCIRRSDNLFAVGDVKQSIYGFRQSRPELFVQMLQAASATPQAGQPIRIDLKENFRSRPEILSFANHLFRRLMRADVCDIDYDTAAELKSGLPWKECPQPTVELWLLEKGANSDRTAENDSPAGSMPDEQADDSQPAETYDQIQTQTLWLAQRIRQLVGADGNTPELIYDRKADTFRPIQYGDIVVLMRNFNTPILRMIEVLRASDVPVHSQQAEGFFQTTEITDCLTLLQALDNPYRDLELAAVLRGPLMQLSETDLVRVRLTPPVSQPLYSQLRRYAHTGSEAQTAAKCRLALLRLEQWRQMARQNRLAELLDEVYYTAGLMPFYAALPNGKLRCANLQRLYQQAVEFQQASHQAVSIPRFVRFIEQLLQERQDWQTAQTETAENAVRLMSAHKSKGLEFPVVFAVNLASPFNLKDLHDACLADQDTLGLRTVVQEGLATVPSLAYAVLARQKCGQALAEEMRILYVMLTRAQQKLILAASPRSAQRQAQWLRYAAQMKPPLADWLISQARSHWDWIIAGLADYQPLHDICQTQLDVPCKDNLCAVQRVSAEQIAALQQAFERQQDQRKRSLIKPDLPAALQNDCRARTSALIAQLKTPYPYAVQTQLPAKWTVSGLVELADAYIAPDAAVNPFNQKPSCLTSQPGAQSALKRLLGDATHRVFEHLPLTSPMDTSAVETKIAELACCGLIPPQTASAIDAASIAAFFQTAVGQAALSAGNRVLREWPFTLAVPAGELAAVGFAQAAGCEEKVIIQGIVDMIVPLSDGCWIVDFKTDQIPSQTALQQKIARYQTALTWYSRAVERILMMPVVARWLYFSAIQKMVAV